MFFLLVGSCLDCLPIWLFSCLVLFGILLGSFVASSEAILLSAVFLFFGICLG